MESSHHFVLVHGLGHGAWCWFKVSALLQAQGHTVTSLDLTSNGINKTPADSVTSVAEYLAPLTHFLAHSVPASTQVILVGHSLGGSSISYAMELFPHKICKAIFVAAVMPTSGSLFLPIESLKPLLDAQALTLMNYGKESSKPTSIHINFTKAQNLIYNKCSLEDQVLASSCLNPTPFILTKEILSLSTERYGRVPRFYIVCGENLCLPTNIADSIIKENPPQDVFKIPQGDHSPFFSLPNTLVELFITIAHK